MTILGMNIDHVATLRQARRTYEPDPVWAAVEAQLGGAQCLTIHLREDRRHIQDDDLQRLRKVCQVKLNLEMATTDAMVRIARGARPHMATLVPEGREEVTTEGGLDVAGQAARLKDVVASLHESGVACSAFIDADDRQVAAAAKAGFDMCEVHTGPYAAAFHGVAGSWRDAKLRLEWSKVADSGRRIVAAGMQFNVGHALTYGNVQPIAALPDLCELHIGHAIVSRAIFVGLRSAVVEMLRLIEQARGMDLPVTPAGVEKVSPRRRRSSGR